MGFFSKITSIFNVGPTTHRNSSKPLFKGTDKNAYHKAGKIGGSKARMSKNYNRFKNRNDIDIKSLFHDAIFNRESHHKAIVNNSKSPTNIQKPLKKQIAAKETSFRVEFKVKKSIRIPHEMVVVAKKIGKNVAFKLFENILDRSVNKPLHIIEVIFRAGKTVFLISDFIDNTSDFIEMLEIGSEGDYTLGEKFEAFTDVIASANDVVDQIKKLSVAMSKL